MTYSVHNFVAGTRLQASDLNEMDEQILANANKADSNETFINGINSYIANLLNNLAITADSDTVYLHYGNTLLSSAELPLDTDDFVPCTAVSIDSVSGTVSLSTGGTQTFTATRVTVDTTQDVRWLISDTDVATVTSGGVVTAVDVGVVTLTAKCGKKTATATISVSKTIVLTGNVSVCNWIGYSSGEHKLSYICESSGFVGNFPFSLEKYKVKNGQTITVGFVDGSVNAQMPHCVVFKAVSGSSIVLEDNRENDNRYYIKNVEKIAENSESIHKKTQVDGVWGYYGPTEFTYTNSTGDDVYLAFDVQDNGNYWTSSNDPETTGPAWVASNVSVVVSPASS